jgi:hypothetical protein
MKAALVIGYWVTCFFYVLAFCFSVLRKEKPENFSALTGVIANAVCLVLIVAWSGQAPAFQLFESLMLAAFILAGVGFFYSKQEEHLPDVRFWVWLEVLLLMGIAAFLDKKPSPYLYDHNYLYIILFHIIRIAVVSLTLFSSALYIQSRFDIRKGNGIANQRAHQGRNFLVLGALLFLTAEYIGIHWCLRGWGDFWQWGAGFLQSTLIIVFFMIAIHVPGSNYRPGNWRPRLGVLSGFLVFIFSAIRSMF